MTSVAAYAAHRRREQREARPRPALELVGKRSRPVVAATRWLAIVGLCAYSVHSLLGTGGQGVDALFDTWVFNALLCAGAALCLLRALCSPLERIAWTVLGAGLGCWALGEIVFTVDPGQVTASSFPSTSDVLWLTFYPASFIALGILVRARTRHFYPSLWLDGAIGALALAALACEFILPPMVAGAGGSPSSVVGDLVYPLGDLLLVCFAAGALAVTDWRPGRVLGTVALGLALGGIADGLSLYWSATGHAGTSIFDPLWPASAVVLGWAAWQPARSSEVVTLHGRRLLVFPMFFAVVALGLLALQAERPLHAGAYLLAVLTVAAAVMRLGITCTENLALVDRCRKEALTDALTGLGNRRGLLLALEDAVQSASARSPWVLLLFDLNGFKHYNDTFGHPVGDAMLARLGAMLADAVAPAGHAYRLGGDEFCVLAQLGRWPAEAVSAAATAALSARTAARRALAWERRARARGARAPERGRLHGACRGASDGPRRGGPRGPRPCRRAARRRQPCCARRDPAEAGRARRVRARDRRAPL